MPSVHLYLVLAFFSVMYLQSQAQAYGPREASATDPTTPGMISIDNLNELKAVEGTGSTCSESTYFDDHADLCKVGTDDPGTTGFWTTCIDSRCDIAISVAKVGGLDKMPISLSVLSYVQGGDAEILIRHKPTAAATPVPIQGALPISNTKWEYSNYDLRGINVTVHSEIVLRLTSGPFANSADILDKVLFHFEEPTRPSA